MPLRELGALAHAHGALLIVDGAQAAGSIEVELEQLGADVYTVSAHKWMLAPPGSALLYLCAQAQELVRAVHFDADTPPNPRSSESYANPQERLASYTHSTGTLPAHTVAGLGQAISYLNRFGMDTIAHHNLALRTRAWTGLSRWKDTEKLELLSPPPGSPFASSLLSFSLPEPAAAAELAAALHSQYSIIVKTTPHHSVENPAGNAVWRNSGERMALTLRAMCHSLAFYSCNDRQRITFSCMLKFGDGF
jgi:selenocysteine lyase/cysteine desulfurase